MQIITEEQYFVAKNDKKDYNNRTYRFHKGEIFMEKTKKIEMTDNEKKDFVAIISESAGKVISFNEKMLRNNLITSAVLFVAGFLFAYLLKFNLSIFGPIYAVLMILEAGSVCCASFVGLNRLISKSSNGKLSYFQYKKILRSGEFEEWKKIENVDADEKQKEESIQSGLTEEEFEVLKKLLKKQEDSKNKEEK